MAVRTQVTVDGRRLVLSNLEKVLYPEVGWTKGQVLDYYARISEVLLPHLAGRELTLKRWPEGVAEASFWEKRCPSHAPEWIPTTRVASSRGERRMCVVDELPALLWAVNLASLELHVSLHRIEAVDRPTALVFDLDPGPPAGLLDAARVALLLRDLLGELGLETVVKTSGQKGLHVYLPLGASTPWARARPFSRAVAELLERQHPQAVVSRMAKARRTGKVYVDWAQNDRHKTTVAPWSLRATPRPQVSCPVPWARVEESVAASEPAYLVLDPEAALALAAEGDPFAPVLRLHQTLPGLLGEATGARGPGGA